MIRPCRVRARRLGRLSPQSRHDAASPRPRSHAVRRERAAGGQWRRQFGWSMGSYQCRLALRHLLRHGGHHRQQDGGAIRHRSSESEWLHVWNRSRWGPNLEHVRPFLGPQWLRYIPAIRWMCRKLDRIKTVVPNWLLTMGQAVSIIFTCSMETNADANSVSSQHLMPVHVRSECLFWVKPGNTRCEQMSSVIHPTTDIQRPRRHVRVVADSDLLTRRPIPQI